MSRGPKWFSDEEKQALREKLCQECEISWRKNGYRKTSINSLTKKVGISTGAFYTLFPSKEDLFLETFSVLINRVKERIRMIIEKDPSKKGAGEALRYLFMVYDNDPVVYGFSSPEYSDMMRKVSKERLAAIRKEGADFIAAMTDLIHIELSVSPEKAREVIGTLLYTVTARNLVTPNYVAAFEFLLDAALDKLFK